MTNNNAFAKYAQDNWLTVSRDDRGWFITKDVKWAVKTMRKEGWNVKATGETQLMADDTIRNYIEVAAK